MERRHSLGRRREVIALEKRDVDAAPIVLPNEDVVRSVSQTMGFTLPKALARFYTEGVYRTIEPKLAFLPLRRPTMFDSLLDVETYYLRSFLHLDEDRWIKQLVTIAVFGHGIQLSVFCAAEGCPVIVSDPNYEPHYETDYVQKVAARTREIDRIGFYDAYSDVCGLSFMIEPTFEEWLARVQGGESPLLWAR